MIYLAHKQRGQACLDALISNGYIPKLVIATDTDIKCRTAPMKIIPTKCITNKESAQLLREIITQINDIDLIISAGYNKIIPSDILSIPQKGSINLHGGKLPQYRGASTTNWQIIKGEKRGYCTIHYMVEELDAGPILASKGYRIRRNDTIRDCVQKQLNIFPKLLLYTLRNLDRIKPKIQNEKLAEYYRKRYPRDGLITWNMAAHDIHNIIRACDYNYSAYCINNNGERVQLISSRLGRKSQIEPGTIIRDDGYVAQIVCGDRRKISVVHEGDI